MNEIILTQQKKHSHPREKYQEKENKNYQSNSPFAIKKFSKSSKTSKKY
jgi:hypothetical protein